MTLSNGEIRAVCYADVFSYPLTRKEARLFSIKQKRTSKTKVHTKTRDAVVEKDGYFFLKHRNGLIALRRKRERYSKKKTAIAQRYAKFLGLIPTIQLVALTGACAMLNAEDEDDIDFFIVTRPRTLWISRFIAILLLEVLGVRRRPGDVHTRNKICLNMVVDEHHIAVPESERDVFSAHEVAQMRVLFSRGNSEQRLNGTNAWVHTYLPNVAFTVSPSRKNAIPPEALTDFLARILGFFEYLASRIQRAYMQKRITHEVIQEGYLRFHPTDARKWILKQYEERLRGVGLK